MIMVDLDGTLSSCKWRTHLVTRDKPDWPAFFDALVCDAPVPAIVAAVKANPTVILMSGRPERYRRQTEWWLMEHEIPYDNLVMRPNKDMRPDHVAKSDMFRDQVLPSGKPNLVIDDRDSVVEMWRVEWGLNVWHAVDPDLYPIMDFPMPNRWKEKSNAGAS